MLDTSYIRKGLKMTMDGQPWQVVEFQHCKPGKGGAFVRTKLKNMISGAVVDRTFRSGEKIEPAEMEERKMQYLYMDGAHYCFMDNETYEQMMLTDEQVGSVKDFLIENMDIDVLFYNDQPIGLTLPNFVEMEIAETEPGIKGDTASGATKPATLATGKTVLVPLFINENELIRIDTRTGEYVERVKK